METDETPYGWIKARIVPQEVVVRSVTRPEGEYIERDGQQHWVKRGDFIVRGPNGKLFQCTPETFNACYQILTTEGTPVPRDEPILPAEERVANALFAVEQLECFDGAHHKQYCIDQVVRALCGGYRVDRETFSENREYDEFVRRHQAGEEGPETYSWDRGVAP